MQQQHESFNPGKSAAQLDFEHEVVFRYSHLVKRIAYHLCSRLPDVVELEDLIQAGMVGLLEAANKFDSDKGKIFDVYASFRIRGSMLDEVRKGDWTPRSVYSNARKIQQAIQAVEGRTGRDAKPAEISKELGMSLNKYFTVLQDTKACYLFASNEDKNSEALAKNGMPREEAGPCDSAEWSDFRKIVAISISKLPERERLVLALYYDEELSYKSIGKILDLSVSRISQLHSQALLRLQSRLKDWR